MAVNDGLISMKPTSIAHTGTSATINADGGVDFTDVTVLSLNGVFTSTYDNYLIIISDDNVSNTASVIFGRLRVAGSDASGSNYAYQLLDFDPTSETGSRSTSQSSGYFGTSSSNNSGNTIYIYGPALAQPTISRCVNAHGYLGARTQDGVTTHSLSTAYDGITLLPQQGITGNVHVFGYEE